MSTTIVETKKPGLKTNIRIRPFITDMENMGLENYGMVVFDGVTQTESLGCQEVNGIKRYITGLNEFAPELNHLDEKERKARVMQIRKDIVKLERQLAQNPIPWKEGDEEFPYDKVKVVYNDNSAFWDKIEVKVHNGDIFLDVENNPHDLIRLRAIEAGGFATLVAPSYEAAVKSGRHKWYLDRMEKTITDKTSGIKLRNKAISKLTELFDKDTAKLRYVLKNILHDGASIINSTPTDLLYEEADSFINGKGQEKVAGKAAQLFLDVANKKLEDLKLRAIVIDAGKHNFLITRSNGKIYHAKSGEMLGGNIEEVVIKLRDPMEEKLLKDIQDAVEAEWQK